MALFLVFIWVGVVLDVISLPLLKLVKLFRDDYDRDLDEGDIKSCTFGPGTDTI